MQELSETLSRLDAPVIRTNPTELLFLVKELRANNLHPKVAFCLIVGQILEEEVRILAEKYLACQAIVHYGTQETAPISIECRTNPGLYHIFSERVIVEILDEFGKNAPHGAFGNVTVTCLDNTVMPLIRYQPGDIGRMHEDMPCSCANHSPLLEIQSRATDTIEFSDGEKRSIVPIFKIFAQEPFVSDIRRFQICQEQLDEIRIIVETRHGYSSRNEVDLVEKIAHVYGRNLQLRIEPVRTIAQDGPKFRVFIPLQKQSSI